MANSTQVAKGFQMTNPGNIDSNRGPYPTLAAANAAIPNIMVDGRSFREGKFVDIGNGTDGFQIHTYHKGFENHNLTPLSDIIGVDSLKKAFIASANQFEPSKVVSGGYRLTDGTVADSVNLIRMPLQPIKFGETHLTISGAPSIGAAQVRFAFFNESNIYLPSVAGDTSVPIPTGAKFYGTTLANEANIGIDPMNNPYSNVIMIVYGTSAKQYTPYGSAIIDINKLQGIQPAVQEKITSLSAGISAANDNNIISSVFPVTASIAITEHALKNNGDYLEFTSKQDPGANVIRMFGASDGNNQNAFGFYNGGFRLRGNMYNDPWIEFTGLPSTLEYRKYKLMVNSGNWELYIDGILKSTKPKISDLIINNIGNAYSPTVQFYLRDKIILNTTFIGTPTVYQDLYLNIGNIGKQSSVNSEKIEGIQPAVRAELAPIKEDLAVALENYEATSQFPLDALVQVPARLLHDDGDYLEFTARQDAGANALRMFGTLTNNVNAFGFYDGGFRLRGNIANAPYVNFLGIPNPNQFHTYRLVVNGSNWDLYVDGKKHQTQAKNSDLLINLIGKAYDASVIFYLKGAVKIYTLADGDLSLENFHSIGTNVRRILVRKANVAYAPMYVYYNPGEGNAHPNTGIPMGQFIVYTRRKGHTSFVGIKILRFKKIEEYYDYWRVYKAAEYTFDGTKMTMINDNILTDGESEFTWFQYHKKSHTGGTHGFEETLGLRMFVDGELVDLLNPIPLRSCESFYYTEFSEMLESPWDDKYNLPPVAGRIVQSHHFKRTDIRESEMESENILDWVAFLNDVLYMYTGIFCIGSAMGTLAHDDIFNEVSLTGADEQKLHGTGYKTMNFRNPLTGYACQVSSEMIYPTTMKSFMWLEYRPDKSDSKYYRVNNVSNEQIAANRISVVPGERWMTKSKIIFT